MRFFILFLLFVSTNVHARTDDFLMRESWVKTMKGLLKEIELKDKNLMTATERKFIEIFASAWADSRYNCFYGGWPSTKKGTLCQSPVTTNSSYDKTACRAEELQCQPLLFGKGQCVPFKTEADKTNTFAKCEEKFQKVHNGKYDFLENPTRKESEDLQELSLLAHEVCTKKDTPICKKLLDKFPSGMKAIDQGHTRATAGSILEESKKLTTLLGKKSDVPPGSSPESHDPECVEPDHEHDKLERTVKKIVEKTGDELYDKIKEEFLNSPFCDPQKITNDPGNRPSAVLIGKLTTDLQKTDPFSRQEKNEDYINRLARKYNLSSDVAQDVISQLNQVKGTTQEYENRRTIIAKVRIQLMQDFIKNYKPDESSNEMLKDALLENHIFTENEEGEAVCPFVSKEAFDKAMAGRKEVLKKHGASLPNKNLITIVDYTRPSNERRMFVIDINTGKVMHNTWVAHGGGNGNADGVDGFGSSPEMSNKPGSNLSSDGFIIATTKSYGSKFGNNVLLRGIDEANANLAARAVVLHGWGSPYYQYSTGIEDYDYETEKFTPPYDVIDRVMKANPSSTDRKELEKAYGGISGSVSVGKYMNPTEGCLGVPAVNVKHLDRKGRDKTQLELLRDDLPGSLIFNYSGPNMSSKFF